jgi:hypothetical protein
MAWRQYAGRHDRHASDSAKMGDRRSKLDESGRRVFAAGEVRSAGWGGREAVSKITGLKLTCAADIEMGRNIQRRFLTPTS